MRVPPAEVPDADIDRALEGLRSRLSDFNDMTDDRGLAMDDFAVLDFAGRIDGQPVNEALPKAPRELAGREGFWIKMAPTALLPGFCDALVGAKPGETREFPVELPADFALEDLAGKKIDYTATVKEIKTQVLPELNDEFAGEGAPRQDAGRAARAGQPRDGRRAQPPHRGDQAPPDHRGNSSRPCNLICRTPT